MPKDTPQTTPTPVPSRLDELRAKFAELQKRVPDLTFERVEPSAEAETKGYSIAKWGRTRVTQIIDPPHTPDTAEIAVLEVTIAHLTRS